MFGEVGTQSLDHLGALSHHEVARPKYDRGSLLLPALEGNKAHRRSLGRLTDRLGISGVVLLPPHRRLHISWRKEANRVTELADLARPMMRALAQASMATRHAGCLAKNSSTV
ncbi:hypothetical protein ACVIYL_008950 [Bradyrhizobium sp. USDA 3315]